MILRKSNCKYDSSPIKSRKIGDDQTALLTHPNPTDTIVFRSPSNPGREFKPYRPYINGTLAAAGGAMVLAGFAATSTGILGLIAGRANSGIVGLSGLAVMLVGDTLMRANQNISQGGR